MIVWVLHYHYQNGDNYGVFTTEAAARASMAELCREFWNDVKHKNDVDEDSFTDDDIVRLYFEKEQELRGQEWYNVQEREVEGVFGENNYPPIATGCSPEPQGTSRKRALDLSG